MVIVSKGNKTIKEINMLVKKIKYETRGHLTEDAADAINQLVDIAIKLHHQNQELKKENAQAWQLYALEKQKVDTQMMLDMLNAYRGTNLHFYDDDLQERLEEEKEKIHQEELEIEKEREKIEKFRSFFQRLRGEKKK